MFGYACRETATLMPAPLYYAHEILRTHPRPAQGRRPRRWPGLLPDAKSQVTLRYVDGKPVGATSRRGLHPARGGHGAGRDQARCCGRWSRRSCRRAGCAPEDEFYVNPTGNFVIGGPDGDCGLTGRKIIVDTYGGAAPHGGGAFSGKDPTKVDRSRRLCLPLPGEERRRRRPGRPLHAADQLRDRRLPPAVGLCRPARHRQGRGRGAAGEDAARR